MFLLYSCGIFWTLPIVTKDDHSRVAARQQAALSSFQLCEAACKPTCCSAHTAEKNTVLFPPLVAWQSQQWIKSCKYPCNVSALVHWVRISTRSWAEKLLVLTNVIDETNSVLLSSGWKIYMVQCGCRAGQKLVFGVSTMLKDPVFVYMVEVPRMNCE